MRYGRRDVWQMALLAEGSEGAPIARLKLEFWEAGWSVPGLSISGIVLGLALELAAGRSEAGVGTAQLQLQLINRSGPIKLR